MVPVRTRTGPRGRCVGPALPLVRA